MSLGTPKKVGLVHRGKEQVAKEIKLSDAPDVAESSGMKSGGKGWNLGTNPKKQKELTDPQQGGERRKKVRDEREKNCGDSRHVNRA